VKNRRNYLFVTGSYRTIKWSDTVMLNSNRDRHVVVVCFTGRNGGATFCITYRYYKMWSLSVSYNYFAFPDSLVK